jgi:hypothetical protein
MPTPPLRLTPPSETYCHHCGRPARALGVGLDGWPYCAWICPACLRDLARQAEGPTPRNGEAT